MNVTCIVATAVYSEGRREIVGLDTLTEEYLTGRGRVIRFRNQSNSLRELLQRRLRGKASPSDRLNLYGARARSG